MLLKKAIIKSFDSENYTATIQLSSSHQAYLEGVAVARNIGEAHMVTGHKLVVAFFDETNPNEAVIIGVYQV